MGSPEDEDEASCLEKMLKKQNWGWGVKTKASPEPVYSQSETGEDAPLTDCHHLSLLKAAKDPVSLSSRHLGLSPWSLTIWSPSHPWPRGSHVWLPILSSLWDSCLHQQAHRTLCRILLPSLICRAGSCTMALHVNTEWIPGICVQLLLVKNQKTIMLPQNYSPRAREQMIHWEATESTRADIYPIQDWILHKLRALGGQTARLRTLGRRTLQAEVQTSVINPWGVTFLCHCASKNKGFSSLLPWVGKQATLRVYGVF